MDVSCDVEENTSVDESKCVNEVVKAILILDHSKKPFKHCDIAAHLAEKPNRKMWSVILDKAKVKLKDIGLTLVEIRHCNSKAFILTSTIKPIPSMYRLDSESEVADRTLLVLVLTFIFMKERSVTNDEIFAHLKQLNIYNENGSNHHYFGDVKKKILSEFVSQLYLEKVVVNKEEHTYEFNWGVRANAEITKMSILKFVCEVGYEGAVLPRSMVSHYEKAKADDMGENDQYDDEGLMEED